MAEIAKAEGHDTFIFLRDDDEWHRSQLAHDSILDRTFEGLRRADAMLLDLDIPAGSQGIGMAIEAGYAKALGMPIVVIRGSGHVSPYFEAISDFYINNDNIKNLENQMQEAFSGLVRLLSSDTGR